MPQDLLDFSDTVSLIKTSEASQGTEALESSSINIYA